MADARLETYLSDSRRYDELLDSSGSVRPHWRPLIDALAGDAQERDRVAGVGGAVGVEHARFARGARRTDAAAERRGSLAGLAGATKAIVFQLASLTDAHWHMSGDVVLMTLVGGLGTVLGPSVGALTIVGLEDVLADKVGPWVTVIMGTSFVLCVLLFRRGIVGELRALIFARRSGA